LQSSRHRFLLLVTFDGQISSAHQSFTSELGSLFFWRTIFYQWFLLFSLNLVVEDGLLNAQQSSGLNDVRQAGPRQSGKLLRMPRRFAKGRGTIK
jgi:hypothetical protein